MPPRKKKQKRRRDNAISITGTAEAIMLANVGTNAFFGLNAWDWATDGWTSATAGQATGLGQLSLHEMIYGNKTGSAVTVAGGQYGSGSMTLTAPTGSNLSVITANVQQNWVPAVIQSVAIPVGFRVGKRMLRKPLRMVNKGLKMAGIRDMVKV